jgi:hypothetical protein
MFDTVGYALIKKDATTGFSSVPIAQFTVGPVRVMEFSEHTGGIMCVNTNGDAIGTFDKIDIQTSFRCSADQHYIYPPDINELEKMAYMMRCIERKGGYPPLLRQMVIRASLAKGKFIDAFLWQKQ